MKSMRRTCQHQSYSHRELILLFVSFLLFMTGMPGHSETWANATQIMARHLVTLVLVFCGLVTPTPTAAPKPHIRVHHVPGPAIKVVPNFMMLAKLPMLHRYTYRFEGMASFHGKPCSHASVLVRLSSGSRSVAKGTITESDGSYALKVAIDAADNDYVDWTIQAYTVDFDNVELAGRQIVRREEAEEQAPITVNNPLTFVVSSAR